MRISLGMFIVSLLFLGFLFTAFGLEAMIGGIIGIFALNQLT